MADDVQNKKDDGMSQGVATIYRALFEELRFAKQQQWMTTNYLLLVLAAIFGIGKAIDQLTVCEKVIGTFLLIMAVGFGYYVLIDLQRHMGRTRKRLKAPLPGHELDRKWQVPKAMIGRRLSQPEAKRLLAFTPKKNSTSRLSSIRRIIRTRGHSCADPTAVIQPIANGPCHRSH
jgi:hypothetical protein